MGEADAAEPYNDRLEAILLPPLGSHASVFATKPTPSTARDHMGGLQIGSKDGRFYQIVWRKTSK